MVLIINNDKTIVNKEFISNLKEINYPIFYDEKIDNYITRYLNEYIMNNDKVIIDYDYAQDNELFYVTFYKYIFNGNKMNSDVDSLLIDIDNGNVSKIDPISYVYDIVQNKFFDNDSKLVALTFDDGPNYNTNKVLNVLEEYNVTATFFILGSKIKGNEYILKRIVDGGNELGNHTFNHLLLTKYDKDKIREEIRSTSDLIYDVTGNYPFLFRPSYGSVNNRIKEVSDYPIIIWNVDTLDWKYHNSKKIVSRVINKVKDGDIVLMHDVYSATANALYTIIPELQSKGYTFVTISELFYYKGKDLESGKVYAYAK